MRPLIAALALMFAAPPAAAQERGIFVFDFGSGTETQRQALADRIAADAQRIPNAAVILCSTEADERRLSHNGNVTSLLVQRGAAHVRIVDAGVCTPVVTGRSNADIGENRVWLALTTVPFLENFRRETLGY